MNLINSTDLLKASSGLNRFGGNILIKFIMYVLKLNKVNHIYSEIYSKDPLVFLDRLIQEELHITIEYNEAELQRIPREGAFYTISNHPYGGLDGIILLWLMLKIRPDYKVLANFILKKIEPIQDLILGVNPFENRKISSAGGLKEALRQLSEGKPVGIFPAGEVSTYHFDSNAIEDKAWPTSVMRMIHKSQVPVVPVYFDGNNSFMFHLLGMIHPILRTIKLPSELLKKKNAVVRLRIGNPIDVNTQHLFTDMTQFGKFLRTKTYLLGTSFNVTPFFQRQKNTNKKIDTIIDAIPINVLQKEINNINEHKLFSMNNYDVYCSPSFMIPNVLNEIGRLREITFRAVNEGTNHSIDLDEYDLFFHHLFIWDREACRIVGAYRVGMGKEIIDKYGIKGFYIHTLFKMKRPMLSTLYESLELGRSFISEEYQRKPLPLFLLWKGILYFLIKNPEYRYLIGPVSVSSSYTEVSKELIIKFITKNYFDNNLAQYISPRCKYRIESGEEGLDIMLNMAHSNMNVMDKIISDIEPNNAKLPILLKKYISLNAKIIGFNIDPKFNMCLDGLIILDLFEVPMNTIESLSKEINDTTILNRFTTESLEL